MNDLPAVLANLADHVAFGKSAVPVAPAPQSATERFNAIMQDAPASIDAAHHAPPMPPAVPVSDAGTPLGLGQHILGSLQHASDNMSRHWETITERLEQAGDNPKVTDLLHVQTQLLQVSIHYELVGKAIAKSTQNIDTMVRLQ